jgi:glycine betaine/proline transport system substrate-binding protein
MRRSLLLACAAAMFLNAGSAAKAADCDKVTFSDVGWTDITTTTSIAKQILDALGYKVDVKILAVPVTYASLKTGDIDVFLGSWIPAQTTISDPYIKAGEIDQVIANLEGTKYTLAVPTYTYEAGLHDFSDIQKFGKELDYKIYGIEPGNEGNTYLIGLTKDNKKGLGKFTVVESSEQGMLSQVRRAVNAKKPVVFLGWEPHPMNANFSLKYLTGGEEFFGKEGVVYTLTRKDYVKQCPNVGALLKNLKFTLPMENEIMGKILDDGQEADKATAAWMKAHPQVLDAWLEGVKTKDGKPGLPAVKEKFGL